MIEAEIQILEQRKAGLLAEAGAALDAGNVERFDEIEPQLVNLNTLIKYAAAADEKPNTDAWDAVKAFA